MSSPPLPNLVIAGAPRCGTTSLFTWLDAHPEVGGSSVKETFFLMDSAATVKDRGRIDREGLEGYRRFFANVPPGTPIVLEATAGYMYQETALETFAEKLTDTKIVFILRRPADRLLSTYRYFSNNWTDLHPTKVDFAGFVEMTRRKDPSLTNSFLRDAFDHGVYVEHLRRWDARCDRDRFRIVILETLQSDAAAVMRELARWLGIDELFYEKYGFPRENENYRVRSRTVQRFNESVRALLPDGRVRRVLRASYRKINTRRSPGTTPEEAGTLEQLDRAYAEHDRALAEQFELDLSRWRTVRKPL